MLTAGNGTTVLADAVQVFGVTLVGVSTATGVKLLFTLGLVALVLLLRATALLAARRVLGGAVGDPRRFWVRQGIQVVTTVVLVLGIVSIWVTPDTDITTGIGLISAGLAFALQQMVLSLAAYFVILRGDTFGIGDRISLGGVRGDVVRLGFLQDDHHGDGPATLGGHHRPGSVGQLAPVHRAAGDGHQRRDIRPIRRRSTRAPCFRLGAESSPERPVHSDDFSW